MKIKRPAHLRYGKSYRISQKNPSYVTKEKLYELTIPNCNIIMTSQTSSLNIAITTGKQPNNLITVENRRRY